MGGNLKNSSKGHYCPTMERISDNELLNLFRNTEKQEYYFRLIIEKYQEKLYWLIRRMVLVHEDADDVLQNTFIKIWKGLPAFRESSGLYTWMYRIATNEAITFLKARQKEKRQMADDPENHIKDSLKSDPFFNGDEVYERLLIAIQQLPAKQKTVFRMRYFDELSYDDISKMLKTSVGALKASYHHAVKKIQLSFNDSD